MWQGTQYPAALAFWVNSLAVWDCAAPPSPSDFLSSQVSQPSSPGGCVTSTEPPGLSKLHFEICLLQLWLWLPFPGKGAFPGLELYSI